MAPLRDYFAVTQNDPIPERLSGLVGRVEALLAASAAASAFDFRADIIKALPALRTFALSLCGDATRADDLVQEAFARAWANQHRFRPGTNFTAWVFTILRNLFYSDLRKAKREVEDADGSHAERLVALSDQEDVSTLNTVRQHLDLLPVAQREVLLLVGAEGFTYEEAADRIGCQVGTVKSRVSRARATLLAGLGLPGADSASRPTIR
ncbi:sigma-70 family RNA polymerase sigma factor [Methylobacterium sp. J-076]|nr:sigma-70 family RNA polymerase sigma factor [Methylobacterium sp. J-076]MCJ2014497.1 sigma-70 family RNA polymerase sigma factor [Methylobacterium sp. J-076]